MHALVRNKGNNKSDKSLNVNNITRLALGPVFMSEHSNIVWDLFLLVGPCSLAKNCGQVMLFTILFIYICYLICNSL